MAAGGRMTQSGDKAKRTTVAIGSLSVDGFQLSDSSYRMSQAGAAKAINEPPVYASRFLTSRDSKTSLGQAFTDYIPEQIEVEASLGDRGQTRINALLVEVVSAYWLYRTFKGNKAAFTLTWALLQESLERRFDADFDLEHSESDRNVLLTQRLQQTEAGLAALREAHAELDALREQGNWLDQQLLDAGLEPWQLPPIER
ncbi:hypothetical protein VB780_07540 [Leptolyngbya sp. CCNP1308]|uniref:hypothetical protein n=1 Tax=Leptolyngbya sp. CCNP1308 TaxID=3110255 RepID=UPI002B206A3A|nr:hypothetical protein [Leptolyngbya sp. CCNP1308]MEA5448414.1 hypothetical protein [Leptolyngbya sp. CCNP1308]